MFVLHIWKKKLRPDQWAIMETYTVSIRKGVSLLSPASQFYELSSWEQWAD